MKAMIKFSVLAILAIIGLVLMVCEAEMFNDLIMSKVIGIGCWVLVWKLFNDWKEDLNKFIK
jgi:hypothetical protein